MHWFVMSETPVPLPPSQVDENLVTPGVIGFLVTFGFMIVVVLLILDMVRRLRRLRYRAEARERIEAEARAAESAPVD